MPPSLIMIHMTFRRAFAGLIEAISEGLDKAFEPRHLYILDESKMHRRGTETHFKITIVSDKFEGQSQVQRQRLVYRTLEECWGTSLHSLSLTTKTLEEWTADPETLKSPKCSSKT